VYGEILRLKHEGGASDRQIARSLNLARSTFALTLERAATAGLRWPLPTTLTDRVLKATLYADRRSRAQRWRGAVAELITLQSEYAHWFEAF
jgi:transposase